ERRGLVALLAGSNTKLANLIDRHGRSGPLQHSRKLLSQRHRAKWILLVRGGLVTLRLEVPVQPSVAGALQTGCSCFHVVLRVEMRPRAVGRTAGVDDREPAGVPQG